MTNYIMQSEPLSKTAKPRSTISALVFCVILSLHGVTSGEPHLLFTVTGYDRLTCNLKEVGLHNVVSVQIVQKWAHPNNTDAVLATASIDGTVTASDFLIQTHSFHQVNGSFDDQREWETWLAVTLFRINQTDQQKTVSYACQVHYTDHPADVKLSKWESTLQYLGSTHQGRSSEVFTIHSGESFYATCRFSSHDVTEMVAVVQKIIISDSNKMHSASWQIHGKTNSMGGLLATRFLHAQGEITFESIIPDISRCCDWSEFSCSVEISPSSKVLKSPYTSLPRDACQDQQVREKDPCHKSSASVKVSPGGSANGGCSGQPNVTNTNLFLKAGLPLIMIVFLAGVAVLVCCVRRSKSNKPSSKVPFYTFLPKSRDKRASLKGSQESMKNVEEGKTSCSLLLPATAPTVIIDKKIFEDLGIIVRNSDSPT